MAIAKPKSLGRSRKSQNRFKFKTLAERLSEINLSSLYRRPIVNASSDFSKFNEELEAVSQLDLSHDFAAFYRSHRFQYSTLEQVVHHQNKLVQSVINSLDLCSTNSVSSFCRLVSALATDLQKHFYAHYPSVFKCLKRVLSKNEEEPDAIEPIFQALTATFNVSWRVLCWNFAKAVRMLRGFSMSRKNYIRQFAGESICFLLRKVKDIPSAINTVLEICTANKTDEELDFVSVLSTEATKNVQGTLHSCAKTVVSHLLQRLLQAEDGNLGVLSYVVRYMLADLGKFCKQPKDVKLIVGLISAVPAEGKVGASCPLIAATLAFVNDEEFIGRWESNADLAPHLDKLHSKMIRMGQAATTHCENDAEYTGCVAELSCFFLSNSSVSKTHIVEWLNWLFAVKEDNVFVRTLTLMVRCRRFPLHVLGPPVSKLPCHRQLRVIIEYSDCLLAGELLFPSRKVTFHREFTLLLSKVLDEGLARDDLDLAMRCSLIANQGSDALAPAKCESLCERARVSDEAAFLLSYLIGQNLSNDSLREQCQSLAEFRLKECSPGRLWLVDTLLSSDPFSKNKLDGLVLLEDLSERILCFNAKERELLLSVSVRTIKGSAKRLEDCEIVVEVLEKCLEVEKCPSDFDTHREKVRLLGRLDADFVCGKFKSARLNEVCVKAIIHQMIGLLAVNLSVLWETVVRLLQSYAAECSDIFYNIIRNVMLQEANIILSNAREAEGREADGFLAKAVAAFSSCKEKNRIDHCLLYEHLWATLCCSQGFSVIEEHNKDFVSLLLRWIEHYDSLMAANMRAKNKPVRRCLIKQLEVLSKCRGVRNYDFGDVMRKHMLEIIESPDAVLASHAFGVLKAYGDPSILNFHERFSKLFDSKSLANQLLCLRNESGKWPTGDEKEEFLDVLLRILYGRLLQKDEAGNHKSSSAKRKSIIQMLYWMGEDRWVQFLALSLRPFDFMAQSLGQRCLLDLGGAEFVLIVRQILGGRFVGCELRTDRLTACLKTLDIAMSELDCKSEELGRLLFRAVVATIAIGQFGHQSGKYSAICKKLIQTSLSLLVKLIHRNDELQPNSCEYEVLSAVLEPQIKVLCEQNANPHTVHLRFFHLMDALSQSSCSRDAFVRIGVDKSNLLSCLTSSLLNFPTDQLFQRDKTVSPLLLTCLDACTNLAKEHGEDGQELLSDWLPIQIDDDALQALCARLNQIVIEMIDGVATASRHAQCTSLQEQVELVISLIDCLQLKAKMPTCDLEPLCFQFVDVLRKSNRRMGEGLRCRILSMLIKYVDRITKHSDLLSKMAEFLSSFTSAGSRRHLLDLLVGIAANSVPCREVVDILVEINAFKSDVISEVDISRRISALRKVNELLTAGKADNLFATMLVHNLCYFVRTLEEFSLRSSVLNCLISLIGNVASADESEASAVLRRLVRELKTCLGAPTQDGQADAVRLLRVLVTRDTAMYSIGRLQCLLSDDPEVDFFFNLHHIQMHRRSRALVRLTEALRKENFPCKLLREILRPMVEYVLHDAVEKLGKPNETQETLNIVQEKALECLGAIIARLPPFELKKELLGFVRRIEKPNNPEHSNDVDMRLLFTIVRELPADWTNNAGHHSQEFLAKAVVPVLIRILFEKRPFSDLRDEENRHLLRASSSTIIIRLLLHLPENYFRIYFASVILKITEFLKSRLTSVRAKARQCLVKIVQSLNNPSHWCFILNELCSNLKRGYERHVLAYTLNTLLEALKPLAKPGDLDAALCSLTTVFNEELFGRLDEEKQYTKRKTPEAASVRSFTGYAIVGEFLTRDRALALFMSFHDILVRTAEVKTVHNVQHCMQNISLGLLQNTAIDIHDLFIISYGLAKKIDIASPGSKAAVPKKNERPESCHILPPEPSRRAVRPKHTMKSSAYVFLTCSFQILAKTLKRLRPLESRVEYASNVDPFVSILVETIDCKYVRVAAASLSCLDLITNLYGCELPSFGSSLKEIATRLSKLLAIFCSPGAVYQQSNSEVLRMCFSVMARLISDVPEFKSSAVADQDEIAAFVESQLLNADQQLNCFVLLRAMLKQEMRPRCLRQIVRRVIRMSFDSPTAQEMEQSRRVVLMYVKSYELHMNEIEKIVFLYTSNLDYAVQEGRRMVVKTLSEIVKLLPDDVFELLFHAMLVTLMASLYNETIKDVWQMKRDLLSLCLNKVSEDVRYKQCQRFLGKLEDKSLTPKVRASITTAIQLLLEINPERYIPAAIPILLKSMQFELECIRLSAEEGHRPRLAKYFANEDAVTIVQHKHRLFSMLIFALNFEKAPQILSPDQLEITWKWATSCIQSDDVVSRIDGVELLYRLLTICIGLGQAARWPFDTIEELVKSVVNDLCNILRTTLSAQLSDRIAACFFLIVKLLKDSSPMDREKCSRWMFGRVRRQVDIEASENMSCTMARTCAIKWVAAIALRLDMDMLWSHLRIVLPILQREVENPTKTERVKGNERLAELIALSADTLDALKQASRERLDDFLSVYAEVKEARKERKLMRKRELAAMRVKDPLVAAKQRLRKRNQKKVKKRRKLKMA